VGGGEWVKNRQSDEATFAFDSVAIERYLELIFPPIGGKGTDHGYLLEL
jgi:hypothetical protein